MMAAPSAIELPSSASQHAVSRAISHALGPGLNILLQAGSCCWPSPQGTPSTDDSQSATQRNTGTTHAGRRCVYGGGGGVEEMLCLKDGEAL